MLSLYSVVQAVVLVLCLGLVFWLCHWLIDYCGVPEPFHKVAKVVLAVAAVLCLIGVLLSLAGYPVFRQ
jgi:uncharacterized membrane protein